MDRCLTLKFPIKQEKNKEKGRLLQLPFGLFLHYRPSSETKSTLNPQPRLGSREQCTETAPPDPPSRPCPQTRPSGPPSRAPPRSPRRRGAGLLVRSTPGAAARPTPRARSGTGASRRRRTPIPRGICGCACWRCSSGTGAIILRGCRLLLTPGRRRT